MKKKITCFCEQPVDVDFPDVVPLSEETAKSILDGDFMNVTCPTCHTVLKPELPFQLVDNASSFSIYFIPEMERTSYLIDKLEYDIGQPDRVVIGYKELVEKLNLRRLGLDDQAVEAVKYYIQSKAQESSPDSELRIYFHDIQGEQLLFHIEGLKKDEIAQYPIARHFYDKILGDLAKKLKEPTFAAFLKPPYVSLQKVYME